ncbi:MAG TPA: CsgG/HfaB family protein [Methylomusa anaerophila]|uniref:Curli production assembly/transport component CsgG n=1 Tax=Methylomusa anaerophila TaxID=1930071 RepID=A0A348ALZ1_9FIRM|nr:CsgG/HfaB family protein [Methylomusa anaerophila]BBB92089.1 curli production assembly/transport component CsgG [Methylomusa anaerophila]HML87897.1 CsgG/HfaB family protein [Methylomusa anaerophila]
MKKVLISFLLTAFIVSVTLLSTPALAAADSGGLRYTVSVTKFENRAGWNGQFDIGDAWGIVMTDILNQTGKFIVLAEKDMRQEAMAEQDFAASGRTAQGANTPQIGQMTPAQIIIKGAITHVQNKTSGGGGLVGIGPFAIGGSNSNAEVNVTMYMVDSTTGQILASKSVVGKSSSSAGSIGYSGNGWFGGVGGYKNDNMGKAIANAVSQGVDWMIGQLPNIHWKGAVVMVRDQNVYINRGSREGVKPGQQFIVGRAEVIRDPNTGEVLDESVTEVGRIQVVNLKEKLAICEIVSGQAEEIEKGMGVELP